MDEKKQHIGARLIALLNENPVRFGLLLLFLLAFSWPYLSFLNEASLETLFMYFFATWSVAIIVLFVSNIEWEDNGDKKS